MNASSVVVPTVHARFDPKLRLYFYLQGLALLALTIAGLPLVPLWLFAGWWWAGRYLDSLHCELDGRHLRVARGVVFRKEKTIPLDRIQDLSLRHGPLQRRLGLCTLRVETAGQSAGAGAAEADLTGLVDAPEFQERVLQLRDRLLEARSGPAPAPAAPGAGGDPVLVEIRDVLRRIESHMARTRV